MAIVLKYGAPGPILAAGYAAGVGHRMHEQQDDALKVWQQNQQQQFQAQQSWLNRAQQSNLQQNYFDQQNRQAEVQHDFLAEQQNRQASNLRDFQSAQTDRTLTAHADESALERQQRERLAQNAQLHADIRSGDMVLPPAVKAKINKLDADLAEITALAPAGKDEFKQEHARLRQEYMGMAVPRSEQTDAEQIAEYRKTLPVEHQGIPLVIKSGEITTLPGWKPDTSVADAQKQREDDLKKYHGEELKMVDDKGNPKKTPDEAATAALARYDAQQRMLRGETPAATPEPQMSAAHEQYQADFMRRIAEDQRRIAGQNAPATAQTALAGPQSSQPSASSTYTDPKTGEVFEKRGNSWVKVK